MGSRVAPPPFLPSSAPARLRAAGAHGGGQARCSPPHTARMGACRGEDAQHGLPRESRHFAMSPRACVIAIAAAALLPLPHARAVFAQTASPAPSLESAAVCNALVVAMDPLDAAPDHSATDYALWLGSLREQPSRVSGTVRVYVGDDRYDIAFSNAQASPVLHHDPLRMPVIVRFANPVVVSGVYLASMGDSDAKPCPI